MPPAEKRHRRIEASRLQSGSIGFTAFLRVEMVMVAASDMHGSHKLEIDEFRRNIATEQHHPCDVEHAKQG